MSTRYDNTKTTVTADGTKYLVPVLYPEVEITDDDLYVIATEGDRYDKLALEFYGRTDYWWVIMAANPGVVKGDSLAVEPGVQIRIPAEPEEYIRRYQDFNS